MFDLVPDLGVRLHSVGRLDFDAEGLLLLTNDGALTFHLTHPRHGIRRVYHVLVEGRLERTCSRRSSAAWFSRTGRAASTGPGDSAARETGPHWVELVLSEGRYREVKRLCRAVGLVVRRLRRVAFGSLELGELPSGQWRELAPAEVRAPGGRGAGRPFRSRALTRRAVAGPIRCRRAR